MRIADQPIPDLTHELALARRGHAVVAGLDEAGRGALAGPVVAAAVVLPLERFDLASALGGVRDSKLLRPAARERWAARIQNLSVTRAVGVAEAVEVDQLGLLPATRLAMQRALAALDRRPDFLLIDHLPLPEADLPQQPITRGDQTVLSIACASVLAKVARDRLMQELGQQHPGYGFAQHNGYGTALHREAIRRLGPCREHRRSYAPVQQALELHG